MHVLWSFARILHQHFQFKSLSRVNLGENASQGARQPVTDMSVLNYDVIYHISITHKIWECLSRLGEGNARGQL